jgi:chaperonin cofactor prefoldin
MKYIYFFYCRKYEKCKQSIITLKTNEETYKNHIKALEKKFEQAADEYEKFKIKALAQIDEYFV